MYDENINAAILGASVAAGFVAGLAIDIIYGDKNMQKRADLYKVLLSAPFVAVGVAPLAVEAYGEPVPPEAISKASVSCLSFVAGLTAESIALSRIVKWLQKGDGQTVVSKPI